MERVDALDGQIRDCANKLEDVLEFHESNQKVQEDEEEQLRKEISSFGETAKKTSKEYMEELFREDDNDDDAAIDVNGVSDFGVEMVGRSEEFTGIRKHLLRKMRPDDLCFYSFLGEKGGGRTKIARSVYEDLSKFRGEYFDCWVIGYGPIGPDQLGPFKRRPNSTKSTKISHPTISQPPQWSEHRQTCESSSIHDLSPTLD